MFNFITKIFLFVSLLLTFNQVTAKPVSGLYDVDLLVKDESADVRWAALKQGMDEVFVRIAGDSVIMDKLKRPAASTYVKQYRYEPVPVSTTVAPATNEAGEVLTHRIKIQYNGSAMEKYLLDNGFPVWGKHRPDVVVWLAVRDGTNEYVLKDADQSLLKAAANEALIRRGTPGRWPLYDYKDRKKLSVADIRGGFNDQVMNASKRYSRGPALTGSIIWNGKQWQSSWNLLMESGNRHWSLVDADYSQLMNKAIDQAADALGVVFAVNSKMNMQQLATIRLDVQAVDSIKTYLQVENYLTNLSAVETVAPLKVDGQNAIFEVRLRSTEEDFLNLIKNGAELIKVEAPLTPENKPAVDIQSPIIDSGIGAENNVDVLSSDEITIEKSDDATLAANQQDQLPVYYYRLNK
jgi:hypothetical protein